MSEYHKIQSIFKRDMASKRKTLIEGQWTLPEFEYLANNVWVFTEKVDGTNIRVIFKDGGVTFGGRTADAQIPAPLVTRLNERFLPLAPKMAEAFPDGAAVLYGEGYGATEGCPFTVWTKATVYFPICYDKMDCMPIDAAPGTKVAYAYPNNGTEFDKDKLAKLGLNVGDVFTVETTEISGFSTTLRLCEFPLERFNTVNFTLSANYRISEPCKVEGEPT